MLFIDPVSTEYARELYDSVKEYVGEFGNKLYESIGNLELSLVEGVCFHGRFRNNKVNGKMEKQGSKCPDTWHGKKCRERIRKGDRKRNRSDRQNK